MAEPIFQRAKRVVKANVENVLDRAERATGTGMMRQAIRDIDQTIDALTAEKLAALDRKTEAHADQKLTKTQIADWQEKARFTMEKGRDDLTQAAISREMELEDKILHLKSIQINSQKRADQLDNMVIDLDAQRDQMSIELKVAERAEARKSELEKASKPMTREIDRKVDRVMETFKKSADKIASSNAENEDIEAMKKDAEIERRLQEMKAEMAEKKSKK